MHKKFYNFLLPILGAVVVVGSGFSAWIFDELATVEDSVVNGKVTVEKGAVAKDLEITADVNNFNIVLDQEGISFKKEGGEPLTEINFTWTLTVEAIAGYLPTSITGKYDTTVTFNEAATTHLTKTFEDVNDGLLTFTTTSSAEDHAGTVTYTAKTTVTMESLGLDYASKPTTYANYKTMYDAFEASGTNAVVITASFVEESLSITK